MVFNRTTIVLLVALLVGGGAAYLANRYLRSQVEEIEARSKVATVKRIVPTQTLAKGATLTAKNVAVRDVPREWAISNGITPEQFDRVDGVALAYPAEKGEQIAWAMLEGQRTPTFSARVTAGRRAVTVAVDEISSISGLLEPNDLIDVIVTAKQGTRQFAFVLLQSVKVLATGTKVQQVNDAPDGARRFFTTITIDVTPEEAREVIAAKEIGKVTAMLRAPGDHGVVSSARSDAAALLGLVDAPAAGGRGGVPVVYGGRGGPIWVPRLNADSSASGGPTPSRTGAGG